MAGVPLPAVRDTFVVFVPFVVDFFLKESNG